MILAILLVFPVVAVQVVVVVEAEEVIGKNTETNQERKGLNNFIQWLHWLH